MGIAILVAATVVAFVGLALWDRGVGEAETAPDPVAVDSSLAAYLIESAESCPDLSPARLAGQIMATTGFESTEAGGIAGLTEAEWDVWAPWADASPADRRPSVLALAHLTCDFIGRIRVSGVPGDRWQLAVAAWQSSLEAVKEAGGIPPSVSAFVERASAYADYYARQPLLGGTPVATTAAPTTDPPPPTTAPNPTDVPTPDGTGSTPGQGSTPTSASSSPAGPAPTTTQPAVSTGPTPGTFLGYVRFTNYQTGRCLDSDHSGAVFTSPCDGSIYQAFAVLYTPYSTGPGGKYSGGISYMDPQTNRCLDSNVEGQAYTLPCSWDNTFQNWSRGGRGPADTVQNYQTRRCLDSNQQGQVYTLPCDWNNTFQNWIIESAS